MTLDCLLKTKQISVKFDLGQSLPNEPKTTFSCPPPSKMKVSSMIKPVFVAIVITSVPCAMYIHDEIRPRTNVNNQDEFLLALVGSRNMMLDDEGALAPISTRNGASNVNMNYPKLHVSASHSKQCLNLDVDGNMDAMIASAKQFSSLCLIKVLDQQSKHSLRNAPNEK